MELFSCCPVKGKTEFLSPFNGLASKYLRRWLMCRNSISVAVKCHWWLCNICQHNLQGSLVSTKGSSGNYGYLLMLHISILSRSSIGMCAESKESVLAEWPLSITQNWGSLWGAFPAPYLSRAEWLWCWSRNISCVSKNVPLWTCWAGCQIRWTLLIGYLHGIVNSWVYIYLCSV